MQLTFAVQPTTPACTIARMEETLGQRIKRLRLAKGLSQSELARMLGIKPQAVQKWEGTGVPRTQRIDAIADALGVTSAMLMGQDEAPRLLLANGESWPFGIAKDRYDRLDTIQKARIETIIEGMILAYEGEAPIKKSSAAG